MKSALLFIFDKRSCLTIVTFCFFCGTPRAGYAGTCYGDTSLSMIDTVSVETWEDFLERSLGLEMDNDLFERMIWLHDHPIDVNDATQEELLSIPGISTVDVKALQRHRRTHGPFRDAFDLAGVDGIGVKSWTLMRPFITVSPRRMPLAQMRSRVVVPVEGGILAETASLGSAVGLYNRLTVSPARGWQCGAVVVADPGERFADGFLSGYVQHESAGLLRRFVLGDFSVSGGLGLVWGQTLRSDAIAGGFVHGSFSPHRSSGEQGFLRGAGVSLGMPVGSGEGRLYILGAQTPSPATIDSADGVTSLAAGGAYTTANSLNRRNGVGFLSLGGRMEFLWSGGTSFGISLLRTTFDHAIAGDGPFELSGKSFGVVGLDGMVDAGPLQCALEYVRTPEGGGLAASIVFGGGKALALNLRLRSCDPGFHSLLAPGGGFGEAVRNRSEVGWRLEVSPISNCHLQAEMVQFRKPWRTSSECFPTGGREVAVETGLRLARGCEVLIRGEERRHEHPAKTTVAERTVISVREEIRRRIQYTFNISKGDRWHVRTRFEMLRFRNPISGSSEDGWMGSADVQWKPASWATLSGRVALFQTDSYDSRVYAIEANVEGLTGLTLLSGTGRRWYCLVMLRPWRGFHCSARYAAVEYVKGARPAGRVSQLALQVEVQIDAP